MAKYLLHRAIQGAITIFLASIAVFAVMRLIPGDPALAYAGMDATPQELTAIRHEFGLEQPLIVQYGLWVHGVFTGNLGKSFIAQVPVTSLIAERLMPTLVLLIGSVCVLIVTAIVLGALAAMTRWRMVDTLLTGVAAVLYGAPVFWTGLLAILLFSVTFRLLPVGGYVDPFSDPLGCLQSMVMPCTVLGLALGASLSRFVRASFREVLSSDYVRLAEAKGASRLRIVRRHVTRNALVPVITVFGLTFATLLGGAVVIESVFSWPGIGLLMINSVNSHDYPTVQAVLLLYVVTFVVINFLTDVSYSLIDPRIRLA